MVHHPTVYAHLLGERIAKHEVQCWLVNTGWSGGAVRRRQTDGDQGYARDDRRGARGRTADVEYEREPFFGLSIPKTVPGVPKEVLNPRNAWNDKAAYDAQAKRLAGLFAQNFAKFEAQASDAVKAIAIRP